MTDYALLIIKYILKIKKLVDNSDTNISEILKTKAAKILLIYTNLTFDI